MVLLPHCRKYMERGQIPPRAAINHTTLPPTHQELEGASDIYERCLSLHLPFGQIRPAPQGGQLELTGGIVNFAADVTSVVNSMKHMGAATLLVELKKEVENKTVHLKRLVDVERLERYRAFLMTKPLYRDVVQLGGYDEWLHFDPRRPFPHLVQMLGEPLPQDLKEAAVGLQERPERDVPDQHGDFSEDEADPGLQDKWKPTTEDLKADCLVENNGDDPIASFSKWQSLLQPDKSP